MGGCDGEGFRVGSTEGGGRPGYAGVEGGVGFEEFGAGEGGYI